MDLDRQLRGMAKAPLTFSAKGFSDEATETALALDLDKLFDAQPVQNAGRTLYQAEMLAKEGKRSEAIAHAFANAQGPEINALNLLYANHATTNPKLRLHFLNKYLAAYGLKIDLDEDRTTDFFRSIKSKPTPKKIGGPLVTVIMPVRNEAANIELAVNSLLAQSWINLQIIIVDDGSDPDLLAQLRELLVGSPVKLIEISATKHPGIARNVGLIQFNRFFC